MMKCPVCKSDCEGSWCEHYVLSYDATFPYAGANNCPLEIDGKGFDTNVLESINGELDRILFYRLRQNDNNSLIELPTRLRKLLSACAEEAVIDEGELTRDEYADHSAFSEYVIGILEECPTYHGDTHFEDSVPMASSAYYAYWATDAEKCSRLLEASLAEDLRILRSLGETSINEDD